LRRFLRIFLIFTNLCEKNANGVFLFTPISVTEAIMNDISCLLTIRPAVLPGLYKKMLALYQNGGMVTLKKEGGVIYAVLQRADKEPLLGDIMALMDRIRTLQEEGEKIRFKKAFKKAAEAKMFTPV
jgi:hypothetical protein